jgi:hypothetical protein
VRAQGVMGHELVGYLLCERWLKAPGNVDRR